MKVQLHDCVSKYLAGSFEQDNETDLLHTVEVEHDVLPVQAYVLVEADGVTLGEHTIPPGSAERVKFSFLEDQMPQLLVVTILTHDEIRTFACDLHDSLRGRASAIVDGDQTFVAQLFELVETKE